MAFDGDNGMTEFVKEENEEQVGQEEHWPPSTKQEQDQQLQ